MADLTLVRNALLRRDVALLLAAIGLIIIAIGGFYFGGQSAAVDRDPPELAADARNQSLRWVDAAAALRRGDTVDWAALTAPSDDLTSRLQALRDTAASGDNESVEALGRAWSALQASGTALSEHAEAYQRVLQQLGEIRAQLSDIGTATAALSDELTAQSAPARQLQLATQLMMRLERVNAALPTVVGTGTNASQNIEALRLESAYFVNDLTRLTGGDDNLPALRDGATRDRATALQQRYQTVADRIGVIVEAAPRMDALQQHAADIPAHAAAVIAAADALQVWPGPQSDPHAALPVVSVLALVLAIAAIVAFFLLFARSTRSGSAETEQRDARQQQAILGLLDEITNLADGDLTVDVTVTEDFTGAIADSINYTVQNMRALVGTINNTSEQLAQSAAQTQQIASRMNQASERQAKDVTAVTTQIAATSQQMQQVAGRAEQLARHAQESVAVAHNGAQTVDRTIQGMNTLREQIQDTAKRIKRLGESSQEIGNIIELINDIAEQTSTLALNASIQAAMAGEQGRGFAVVAEEVQRLAERASTATRQIENLVKTIQADTNEAIISMERSTHNVVSGARSAEEAGGALTQVETSSQQIARLIQEISGAARNQSAAATTIAGQMQNIREIAVQTSGSAGQTAHAIGELNALSEKLRASVAGFKLPE